MHSSDILTLLRVLIPRDPSTLLLALLAIFCLAGFIVRKRFMDAKARAEKARREAELADLEDESRFMPLPAIEQAVEIADPVQIDSLLEGESEAVQARALALLTAPTNVSLDGGDDLPRYAGKPAGAAPEFEGQPTLPPPVTAPLPAARAAPPRGDIPPTVAIPMPRGFAETPSDAIPVLRDAISPGNAPAPRKPAGVPKPMAAVAENAPIARELPVVLPPQPPPPPKAEESKVPVRDLLLTWYEARGYRAKAVSVRFRPIELELRHQSDPERTYAFVVARERMTSAIAATMLKMAKAAGQSRLLVAAEAGADPFEAREMRRMGVRVFDEYSIRQELEKIDLRIAAKIIAVARSRNVARTKAPPAPATVPGRVKSQAAEVAEGA